MPNAAAMRRESNAPEQRLNNSPLGLHLARGGTGANTSELVRIGYNNSGRERAALERGRRHEGSCHDARSARPIGLREPPDLRAATHWCRHSGRTASGSAKRSTLRRIAATSWVQLRRVRSTGSPARLVRHRRGLEDRHMAGRCRQCRYLPPLRRPEQAQDHVCEPQRYDVSSKQRMNTDVSDGAPEEHPYHQSPR